MRLFLIFAILCGFYNEAYGKGSLDIDMKLKSLNKPSLKTIKVWTKSKCEDMTFSVYFLVSKLPNRFVERRWRYNRLYRYLQTTCL